LQLGLVEVLRGAIEFRSVAATFFQVCNKKDGDVVAGRSRSLDGGVHAVVDILERADNHNSELSLVVGALLSPTSCQMASTGYATNGQVVIDAEQGENCSG
jgi:hypothetical protein